MSTLVTVGHQVDYSFIYVDTSGNPMLTPVTPDSQATWSNAASPPEADTFTPSADGNSAVVQALAAGSDTVSVSVTVNSVTFSATDQLVINAAPQVLGGVQVHASVT